MKARTAWLFIVGSIATCQIGLPQASSSPDGMAGRFSSVDQGQKDNPPQASPQALRMLLTAKTVLLVGEPSALNPTSKAEETLKKALVKWGRFQVVDDAETADLIIVISEYSSSKPKRLERVTESLTIFIGGYTPNMDATPLRVVKEVGSPLGQRPTGKLVEDLRKYVTELERSVPASSAFSPM